MYVYVVGVWRAQPGLPVHLGSIYLCVWSMYVPLFTTHSCE
jgi:hypothetical protein